MTPEQEKYIAETRGTVERIAAKIVTLPVAGRPAYFASVRANYEEVFREKGIEGEQGARWLDVVMKGIEALVQDFDQADGKSGSA